MRYGVLGPVELVTAAGTEPVRGSRQRALLAVLLAHRGALVPRERLIVALWPDGPPPSAEHTLHSHASRVRGLVGSDLRAVPGGYRLDPQDLDADRFDRALRATVRAGRDAPDGRDDDARGGVQALADALALWRGPAFGSEADLPEVQAEAERLDAARRTAHEALARVLLATDPTGAADAAERALDGDPYREGAWALLVRARTAEGRPGEAVLAYLRAAAALDEIGLLPSHELHAAHAAALAAGRPRRPVPRAPARDRIRADGMPTSVPPTVPVSVRVSSVGAVPRARTSFVGREDELAALRDLLPGAPLVTLVGPGGVGKTRLALEVAHGSAPGASPGSAPGSVPGSAPGGTRAVRCVELGAVRDPAAVPAAVAEALDPDPEDPPARTLSGAGRHDLLLVLDGCEHLAGAVAECVDLLLSTPGPLRVLATSRTPLGVPGEHVLPVEPLGTTGARSPAARLFRERSRAAGGRAASLSVASGPTGAAAPAGPAGPAGPPASGDPVARIVRRLDGLPLAVEMAAARTATLTPADVADQLDARLDARLDTCRDTPPDTGPDTPRATPQRDTPPRHRSLAALVAWSRELLPPDARRALDGWPVLATACPPDLAARVLDVPVATAEQLAASALLVRDDLEGLTRYRMPQTVRTLVGPPGEPVRARHAAVMLEVAQDADRALRGAAEPEARTRLAALLPDLRLAHAWAATHDPDLAVRLTRALHRHAVDALRTDVLAWPAPGREDAPAVLAALAARALVQGRRAAAGRRASAALAGAGDSADRLHALEVLADLALVEGRTDEAVALGARIATEAQHAADPHYRVVGLSYPALVAAAQDRPTTARAALTSLRHATRSAPSDRGLLAFTTGEVLARSDPDGALAALVEARELAELAGNRALSGAARAAAGAAVARRPDPAGALAELLDLARTWARTRAGAGDRVPLVTALRSAVPLLLRLDRAEDAARLLGTVTARGLPPTTGVEGDALAATRARLATRLGGGALAALEHAGRSVDLASAVDRLAATPEPQPADRSDPPDPPDLAEVARDAGFDRGNPASRALSPRAARADG